MIGDLQWPGVMQNLCACVTAVTAWNGKESLGTNVLIQPPL